MSKPGPSNISQGSLLDLKAITAEHVDRFAKEGRTAVRGANRKPNSALERTKDPFLRPSPGLVRRLAQEAQNDAKRRHFMDDASGPSDEQRKAILEAKAKKYEAMSRGDLSAFSERELADASIDFDRKIEEGEWSDHSSDVDESAAPPKRWSDDDNDGEPFDDLAQVEYVDEMGRTRLGTRREARDAERAKKTRQVHRTEREGLGSEPIVPKSSYEEVLQSTLIHGEQSFFPVYQPDPEAIKAKYLEAEREARAHHYDASKEVRNRGAGAYQFSLDEEKRAAQKAALDAERASTELARSQTERRGGQSAAQEAKKRKLEERKALVEAKRAKLLGGAAAVEQLREEKRAKEAEQFLKGLEDELGRDEKLHDR